MISFNQNFQNKITGDNIMSDYETENARQTPLQNSTQHIRRSNVSKYWRFTTGLVALALVAFQIVPSFAAINNTVTATGTAPGGGSVIGSGGASVTVQAAAPTIDIIETITFFPGPTGDVNGNGKADPGDKVAYSYQVTNTGNVTLKDVIVTTVHDGVGTPLSVVVPTTVTTDNGSAGAGTLNDSQDLITSDNKWGKLGPADVITFTSIYTVVPGDIAGAGGGTGTGATGNPEADGYLDTKATVNADYVNGATTTPVTDNDKKSIQLNIAPGLQVLKTASPTGNVAAGQVITYTYTVTNTGNTPVNGIALADTHNGVANALTPAFQNFNVGATSTHTGNLINTLQPGDVATYTATYTVTQTDVDTRQGP